MKRIISLILALMLCFGALAEVLQTGDTGEEVLTIQRRLAELGYTQTETDGTYGSGTEEAIRDFQSLNGLLETGMCDDVTKRVLLSDEAIEYSEYGDMPDLACDAAAPVATSMLGENSARSFALEDDAFDTREYTTFGENGFVSAATSPLSTFAADVDTASWTQIREALLAGEEVDPDMVRVEEILNYFHYDYAEPQDGEPFGVTMELGDCPWQEGNKLLLIGLQAETIEKEEEQPKNLVFLIDVSGSMDDEDKLPLAKRAFLLLLDELADTDTVSIVTYASRDEIVLDGVPASDKTTIMAAINGLMAGGSTNGAAGITTAYELAEKHFIKGGVNRILLATDGDLNVGVTSEGELARLVSEKKENGVALSVMGFGGWNYKDNRMEALADYGDGNYWYIDSIHEARRALVTEGGGTFNTVAKDVKLQLDFNPAVVKGYRLIGYEDRLLADEDFADDAADGGEIGSGHRVTALYEIVPAGSDFDFGGVESKYTSVSTDSTEWLTLSIRAKEPDGDESRLYTYTLADENDALPTENLTFAAGAAEVGMLLRGSEWSGAATYESALELLRSCDSVTGDVYKEELVYLCGLLVR